MESCLFDFEIIRPSFEKESGSILEWLKKAHLFSLKDPEEKRALLATFQKLEVGTKQIKTRGTQLQDLNHENWDLMSIFRLDLSPQGLGLKERTELYIKEVFEIFQRFYPENRILPDHLIHVTCTGYASPSGAQKIVSLRKSPHTDVTHSYHMGCYGAFPAIKMGVGFLNSSPTSSVHIVHTEMCSLHINPSFHHKAQLVIESLFADGFIRYQVSKEKKKNSLKILAVLQKIIPDSSEDMTWDCHNWGFCMNISKEVPYKIGAALPSFLEMLSEKSGISQEDFLKKAFFAIHPGGPKIIDMIARQLKLQPWQIEHSNQILSNFGNMSSATIPHIWQSMLGDPKIPEGALIVSLAFGPGLTCAGTLLQKQG